MNLLGRAGDDAESTDDDRVARVFSGSVLGDLEALVWRNLLSALGLGSSPLHSSSSSSLSLT